MGDIAKREEAGIDSVPSPSLDSYVRLIVRGWRGLLTGSVCLLTAGIFLTAAWVKALFICVAVLSFLIISYVVWAEERKLRKRDLDRLESKLNEATKQLEAVTANRTPEIHIRSGSRIRIPGSEGDALYEWRVNVANEGAATDVHGWILAIAFKDRTCVVDLSHGARPMSHQGIKHGSIRVRGSNTFPQKFRMENMAHNEYQIQFAMDATVADAEILADQCAWFVQFQDARDVPHWAWSQLLPSPPFDFINPHTLCPHKN